MTEADEQLAQLDRRIAEILKEERRLKRQLREIERQEELANANRGPYSQWRHPRHSEISQRLEKILKDAADLQAKRIAPAHGDGGLDPEDPDLAAPKAPKKPSAAARFLARILVKTPEAAKPREEEIVVDEDELEAELMEKLGEKK